MNKDHPSLNFFNSVDFPGIVDTIKGVYTSDGAMSTLLDWERVLDEADLYAFRNWELGELVSGPRDSRYAVSCILMYPKKLMPDPRAAKRLMAVGCKVQFMLTNVKMPVEIDSPDDYAAGTRYPKMKAHSVWLVHISIPKELMNDIREGSIELADQEVDLADLDDAYVQDLDKAQMEEETNNEEAEPEEDTDQFGANDLGGLEGL